MSEKCCNKNNLNYDSEDPLTSRRTGGSKKHNNGRNIVFTRLYLLSGYLTDLNIHSLYSSFWMSILVFFREKQRNPRHNYLAIPTLLSTVWQSFLWCGCKVADSFFFPFFEGGVESGEAGRRRRRTRQETTFCLSESNTTYNPTSSCSPLLGCFVYSMRKFFPLPYRISPDVHSASKNKQNFKQCLFLFLAGPK